MQTQDEDLSGECGRCGFLRTSAVLLLAVAIGCSSHTDNAADSATRAVSSSASIQAPRVNAAPDTCVKNGKWAACSVERRLKQSGFVVTTLDSATGKPAGFSVTPVAYSLGKSKLQVFIYKTEAAASHDAEGLDTVAVAPKGRTNPWPVTPMFIRSANMLAVLLTEDARQAERAVLALTAGPPQPGSSR